MNSQELLKRIKEIIIETERQREKIYSLTISDKARKTRINKTTIDGYHAIRLELGL